MTNSPKNLKLTTPRESEKSIQDSIVNLLRNAGFTVLELGQKRLPVICRQCHTKTWPTFTDSTAGTPDLAISHPSWGRAWLMLETKGQGTRRRAAQTALVDAGQSAFITSARQAARDVLDFEYVIGKPQNIMLNKWLEATL